jgi:hypothetical protein
MNLVSWLVNQVVAPIVLGTIFLGAFAPVSFVLRCFPARQR